MSTPTPAAQIDPEVVIARLAHELGSARTDAVLQTVRAETAERLNASLRDEVTRLSEERASLELQLLGREQSLDSTEA